MSSRIPLPLVKLLDEISCTSTTPLSEMRPLLGEECYELIGHIRRLELGITTPGIHRNLLERLVSENAELRLARAVADKDRAEAMQVAASAVDAGERMANTLRSTSESLALCQRAYQEERERMDWLEENKADLWTVGDGSGFFPLRWTILVNNFDETLERATAREAIDAARVAARKEGA
jgi:hypothetical protein